jgi:hypothetical protein
VAGEEDHQQAEEMLSRFQAGESKSALEIEYWDDPTSHGKHFTSFVRRVLGVETEGRSHQSSELERLANLLRLNGISPSPAGDLSIEDRLVANARQAALAAIRLYNDPSAGFRTETFVVLMIIAWNCLFQARLELLNVDYRELNDDGSPQEFQGRARYLGTWDLAIKSLNGAGEADILANLDFFLGLRHLVEHRYLPAVDVMVAGEAQSMLLNFEELLVSWFGDEARLGTELVVPLQLSQLRPDSAVASMKKLQAEIPVDVMDFLNRHRAEVSPEVLRSPRYAMQLFFVPVAANRERSADAVVNFFKVGEVPSDLEEVLQRIAVVAKPKAVAVASADLLSPTEVVNLVSARLPYRFTLNGHAKCWRHFRARPSEGAAEPTSTDTEFCIYDKLHKGYGYTQDWVEMLLGTLSDTERYREIIGTDPTAI